MAVSTESSIYYPAQDDTSNTRIATTANIYNVLDIVISYVVNLSTIIFGIGTNTCNIYVYFNFGFKDSVSICFLALSSSDLCLLTLALCGRLMSVLTFTTVRWPVNLFHLGYLIVWYFQMMLDISTFTTTYIALQRCLCVALPFKVKTLFTRNRTVASIGCIYFTVFSCYVPVVSKQYLRWSTDHFSNISMNVIYYAEGRDTALAFADVAFRIVFRILPQIIVIACLGILVNSLRVSMKFRHKLSLRTDSHALTSNVPKLNDLTKQHLTQTNVKINLVVTEYKQEPAPTNSQRKEKHVMMVVTLTCIIFIVTNTPSIFLGLTRRLVPDFNLYQKYHDIFYLSYNLNNTLQFLNATINFFVYFKYNSRFRASFLSRFGSRSS